MNLDQILEAILFASGRPLGVRKLSEITESSTEEIENALEELSQRLKSSSGLMLQEYGHNFELVTKPNAAEAVKKVVKDEEQGELTRASLEALTILAYRGPMTRPELEQVRGIQSAMILRNLMIRGLVEQKDDERLGQPTYAVTFDFLKHLGLSSVKDLPDYEVLRGHAAISDMLEQLNPTSDSKEDKSSVDSLNV